MAVVTYSQIIFEKIFNSKNHNPDLTPTVATDLLAVGGALATALAFITVKKYPRRQLLIPGYILVCTACFFIALTDVTDFDVIALILVFSMVVSYFAFNLPTGYLYMYEVGSDSTVGICQMAMFVFQLLFSLMTPLLIEKLGSSNTFVFFCFNSACGAIFTSIYMRETAGLNDKEKKRLYRPDKQRGGQLMRIKTDEEANLAKKKELEKILQQVKFTKISQ